ANRRGGPSAGDHALRRASIADAQRAPRSDRHAGDEQAAVRRRAGSEEANLVRQRAPAADGSLRGCGGLGGADVETDRSRDAGAAPGGAEVAVSACIPFSACPPET